MRHIIIVIPAKAGIQSLSSSIRLVFSGKQENERLAECEYRSEFTDIKAPSVPTKKSVDNPPKQE